MQSSRLDKQSGANNAINGRLDDVACTKPDSDPTQLYWKVEFESPLLITGVKIYNHWWTEDPSKQEERGPSLSSLISKT